jgi:integrase
MSAPSRKKVLTDRFLQSLLRRPLKPDDPEYRKPWWDTLSPGLCVRPGADLPFYTAKRGDNKFKWVKLGDYPALPLVEARRRNNDTVASIVDGRPLPVPSQGGVTLNEIAEEFIELVLPTTRRGREKARPEAEEKQFRDEILAVLGDRPFTDVHQPELIGCLEAIAGRQERVGSRLASGGPHAVRKIIPTLNRFYEWAVYRGKGGLTTNPMLAITTAMVLSGKAYDTVRTHVPSDHDLAIIWRAAELTPYPFGPLIRALILTGQRRSEIAWSRWSEISEDGSTLLLSPERMKNRQPHEVPLTKQMQDLLDTLPRFEGGGFLFSTTNGRKAVAGFSKMKARFDRTVASIGPVADWKIHDIRRFVRTALSRAGVLPFIAELVVAHQQSGVHAVYDKHRYFSEKLDALQRWEQLLVTIIGPSPPNVVSLREAAA